MAGALILLVFIRKQELLITMTITFTLVIQQFPPPFLCFSWMLRFKHSTYHSHFLHFIAITSGLEALHLSRSITLQHALALLLSFLAVLHSLSRSLALFPSLYPSSSLSSCIPPHLPSPPPPPPQSYLLIICFILSAS